VLKEVLSEERKGREDRKGRKAKISLRTLRSLRSTCVFARTGETIRTFGTDGRVNMREGPFRPLGGPSGTAGRVFENLFLTGSTTGEGYGSPPGDLRAFDVITGKLVWTFHTIPHPGEFGHDTWPKDAWEWAGGANTWGEISVDEKRGIAYFPIGSATHDSFGGDRKGANLFANCLLALDARTGKRLWHFQAVHHDIWDYDLTTAPKLLTVRDPSQPGKMIDVVAQATKIGFLMAVSSWSSARRVWAARLGKTSGTSGTSRSCRSMDRSMPTSRTRRCDRHRAAASSSRPTLRRRR